MYVHICIYEYNIYAYISLHIDVFIDKQYRATHQYVYTSICIYKSPYRSRGVPCSARRRPRRTWPRPSLSCPPPGTKLRE